MDLGSGVCCLDESGFSHLSLVKCLDIHVSPDALVVFPINQGYMLGSLHHEGSMCLNV